MSDFPHHYYPGGKDMTAEERAALVVDIRTAENLLWQTMRMLSEIASRIYPEGSNAAAKPFERYEPLNVEFRLPGDRGPTSS